MSQGMSAVHHHALRSRDPDTYTTPAARWMHARQKLNGRGVAAQGHATASIGFLAQHFVLFDPGDRLLPAVLGRLLAVARPEVRVEAVRRAGIDLEFGGLFGGLEFFFHLLDLLDLDARILGAVQT